eukprot:Amastigsp_a847955_4.p3 type:complete len:118 gc:universal Amastigsp_a847955_4:410-57(-)
MARHSGVAFDDVCTIFLRKKNVRGDEALGLGDGLGGALGTRPHVGAHMRRVSLFELARRLGLNVARLLMVRLLLCRQHFVPRRAQALERLDRVSVDVRALLFAENDVGRRAARRSER